MKYNSKVKKIANNIKSLKIQSASKVLNSVIQGIKLTVKESKAKTIKEFKKELKAHAILLAIQRPTEPAVRNFLRYLFLYLEGFDSSLIETKEFTLKLIKNYFKERELIKESIVKYGIRKIPKNAVILTHCHSNTVEKILIAAKDKKIKVICTETRPLFQGRITAQNLSKAGIPVTLIVDSAVASIINKIDLFISGADAILVDGSLVNKIGTSTISQICDLNKVPHYVASSLFKFDPITYFGYEEIIEERPSNEVWKKKIKKIKIKNKAFDVTQAASIQAYITEKGIISPHLISIIFREEFNIRNENELGIIKQLIKKK